MGGSTDGDPFVAGTGHDVLCLEVLAEVLAFCRAVLLSRLASKAKARTSRDVRAVG